MFTELPIMLNTCKVLQYSNSFTLLLVPFKLRIGLIAGLVRAPIITTFTQVFSRIFVVWGIVDLFPNSVRNSHAYPIMLFVWSITEIIRYSFYAWNTVDEVPYLLVWLRYFNCMIWLIKGTLRFGYCIRLVLVQNYGR